jgi:hypothetical protein
MFKLICYDKDTRKPIVGEVRMLASVPSWGLYCVQVLDGKIVAQLDVKDIVCLLVPVSSRYKGQ